MILRMPAQLVLTPIQGYLRALTSESQEIRRATLNGLIKLDVSFLSVN